MKNKIIDNPSLIHYNDTSLGDYSSGLVYHKGGGDMPVKGSRDDNKYTESGKVLKSQIAWATKHDKENYDTIKFRLPKGYKDILKEYVKKNGTSVNALLKELVDERLASDDVDLSSIQKGD